MPTNTRESGLETLIVDWLVTQNGYEKGENTDYNKEYAIDETRLLRFLETTQPKQLDLLGIRQSKLKYEQFLSRLTGEIAKRGIIDVLRKGVKIYPANVVMFYQTPSEKNPTAQRQFVQNIFSVTRQLMYSKDNTRLALDFCIFINGLPVITCELKNQLTKQDALDAVEQYKVDRDPKELLFSFKRCMVHFAVDDARVLFCTKLAGKASWFLPFDKGHNDGAGNPPNPGGIMTDYLWKEILTKLSLANIIENYAQVIIEENKKTKKKTEKQIFPRYHQLKVVRSLLDKIVQDGVGKRYLIQHSAGSGKSNSIAWLTHQLVGLEVDKKPVIDSIIVVTDRVNLDKQICNTIKQFSQVGSLIGHADNSREETKLKTLIQQGKKIIITTVHKFPFILNDIGTAHKGSKFAIIIDEAHSSQSGDMSAKMNVALGGDFDPNADTEDKINALVEGRKMLTNASYFAFTATPKGKTIQMFGEIMLDDSGNPILNEKGEPKREPFDNYSMKQAIQEGFILDVLKYLTPIKSFYKLIKTVTDDPEYDKKKAQKKLRAYVEGDQFAINTKVNIMVEHFHENVCRKINGQARAMVVTASVERAIDYYYAIKSALEARKSPYKAVIAFSGEREYGTGQEKRKVSESSINGFPSNEIEDRFAEDPYRILVVAEKFQTGYDEPLLHTMYVDKILTDIKAVQTLSRLNRAKEGKFDTFVLDFANEPEEIQEAFSRYYRTTILSGETDPNKLYDLISTMDNHEVYTLYHVDSFVELYLNGAERNKLDPILDICVNIYKSLDENGQVEFKSAAKSFVRTYGFLGAILPYGSVEWEKLSIFLNLLLPKLPSPKEEDLSAGILENIDLDSYRAEARSQISIQLEDRDAEVDPVPTGGVSGKRDPELDLLTNILSTFNDLFGNIDWKDADNVKAQIRRIPSMVSNDTKYQNAMKNSDKQNARMESDAALQRVIFNIMADNMEIFKQWGDNPSFKKWLADMVFSVTYNSDGTPFDAETEI